MGLPLSQPVVLVIGPDHPGYEEYLRTGRLGGSGQEFGPMSGQGFEQKFLNTPDSGNVSAQKSGTLRADFPHEAHGAALRRGDPVQAYDPHQVHRDFPARWKAYIRANFRNIGHVQQVFRVSERAARKWWNGEGGVNGGYVGIAMREHPVAAERMLFAAE